jgi:hypothetical protein
MDAIKRHHGIYRAVVKDNKDPNNLRRIKVSINQVTGNETTDWIWPVLSTKRPPKIGTGVYIFYIGGDPDYPVWIGEFGKPEDIQGVFCCGSWYSTSTQTITSGSSKAVTVNTTDLSQGIKVVDTSKFTVDYDAVYNFQFSLQLIRQSGGGNGNTAQIWLAKNGVSVPNSNTRIDVTTNAPQQVAAWNFFIKLKKNDYVQLMWSANTSSMEILANPAVSPAPAIPSAIVTMNQIA